MTPDAVVRAWFKEVWDEGNEDAIDRLMAPDAVAHGLGPDGIRGPEAFKPYVRTMRAALGDLEIEVTQTLTDGDRVAAHCHVVARHAGALFAAELLTALRLADHGRIVHAALGTLARERRIDDVAVDAGVCRGGGTVF